VSATAVPTATTRGRVSAAAAFATPALSVASVAAVLLTVGLGPGPDSSTPLVSEQLPGLAMAAVASVLLLRRPRHAVGWVMAAAALASATSAAGQATAAWWSAVPRQNTTPVLWAELASQMAGTWAIACTGVLLPLLFPTGRVPSPRWRPVLRLAVLLLAVFTVAYPLAPDTVERDGVLVGQLPLAVPALRAVTEPIVALTFVGTLLLVPVAIASVVVRYRAAVGVERQQLRWFAVTVTSAGSSLAIMLLLVGAELLGIIGDTSDLLIETLLLVPLTALPVTIGLAVLRYRLYDIDRIVSRTLGYTVLTATLVAVYGAVVLLAQAFLGPRDAPDAVIAGATLVAAALFQPLRLRIQRAVDRRFDRGAYDADRVSTAFGGRLRDEVDLEQIATDLTDTVRHAVQPASLHLWTAGERVP